MKISKLCFVCKSRPSALIVLQLFSFQWSINIYTNLQDLRWQSMSICFKTTKTRSWVRLHKRWACLFYDSRIPAARGRLKCFLECGLLMCAMPSLLVVFSTCNNARIYKIFHQRHHCLTTPRNPRIQCPYIKLLRDAFDFFAQIVRFRFR